MVMTTDVAPDRFIVDCDRVLDSEMEPMRFSDRYFGFNLNCTTEAFEVTRWALGKFTPSVAYADGQELFHLFIHEQHGWSYEYYPSALRGARHRYKYTCPSCADKLKHPY